jgi:pyruvate kinase
MNYQIVATLGPATSKEETWQMLIEAGTTAFRLNTSHFGLEELGAWLNRVENFLAELADQKSVGAFPVILDLQASKWRIGMVETAELDAGQSVELVLGAVPADDGGDSRSFLLPIPHPDFFTAAQSSSGKIAVNDAKVILHIESIGKERIAARVVQGGEVSTGKGITIVGSRYRKEQLNDKDRRVVELSRSYPFVRYALSYVKDAGEMRNYRALFDGSTYLVAKLERASAVQQAVPIAQTADELWICRGDLGAEMGVAAMAEELFRFSGLVGRIDKPVYLAGQVLEHMTEHPAPTRSEISYLYEVLQLGFRGVVLSDETAVGTFPVESCRSAAMFRRNQAT